MRVVNGAPKRIKTLNLTLSLVKARILKEKYTLFAIVRRFYNFFLLQRALLRERVKILLLPAKRLFVNIPI